MDIYEALDINLDQNELVCFVGAGGKTTALFKLAQELKHHRKKVLVTTTTAIFYPEEGDCDEVIVDSSQDSGIFTGVTEGSIIGFGKEHSPDNKLLGVERESIDELYQKKVFHYILVEGDGSKRRPIKAPASYEPVIPDSATKTVGLIGLDAIGKRIGNDCVHRPELFCKVTGSEMDDVIDEGKVARLILSPEGLFKALPEGCRKYLLLNKAESEQRERSAMSVTELVKKGGGSIHGFIVANMFEGRINRIA